MSFVTLMQDSCVWEDLFMHHLQILAQGEKQPALLLNFYDAFMEKIKFSY